MNDTPNNNSNVTPNNPRGIPRAKLWIFFFLFLTVGIGMYAGTMYRIQNYGYVGIGDDRIVNATAAKVDAAQPEATPSGAAKPQE